MSNFNYQVHHIIPLEIFSDKDLKSKLQSVFGEDLHPTIQSYNNRIALPTNPDLAKSIKGMYEQGMLDDTSTFGATIHNSSHGDYNKAVEEKLKEIFDNIPNVNNQRAAIIRLQDTLTNILKSGEIENINNKIDWIAEINNSKWQSGLSNLDLINKYNLNNLDFMSLTQNSKNNDLELDKEGRFKNGINTNDLFNLETMPNFAKKLLELNDKEGKWKDFLHEDTYKGLQKVKGGEFETIESVKKYIKEAIYEYGIYQGVVSSKTEDSKANKISSGDVVYMVDIDNIDEKFEEKKLENLLSQGSVKTINGLDVNLLKTLKEEEGIKKALGQVIASGKSLYLIYGGEFEKNFADGKYQFGEIVNGVPKDLNKEQSKDYRDSIKEIENKLDVKIDKEFISSGFHKVVKNTPFGIALLPLMIYSTSIEAAEAEAQGDTERAKEIWEEFIVGEASGEIASTLGVIVGTAAGIAILGLSAPVAAVAGIAVGVVAGIFGEDAGKDLYKLTKDLDGNGKADIFDRMGKLLFGEDININQIPDKLKNNATTLEAKLTALELVKLAKEDIAYRYALVELNPFVLKGIDYDKFNKNGELELYSKDNPNGLTTVYLEKRAEMLQAILQLAENKEAELDIKHAFVDLKSETQIEAYYDFIWKLPITKDLPQVIFGGEKGETLTAKDTGDNDNFLFGGAGNDTLIGNAGNDYLEGGAGYDTYHIKDNDTIFDADGKGQILFDGKALSRSFIKAKPVEGEETAWESKDSKGVVLYTAKQKDNDLLITSAKTDDTTLIKNFFKIATTSGTTHSALSIVLGDSQEDIDKEGVYTIKTDDKLHANIYVGAFPSKSIEVIGSDKIDWINAGNIDKKFDINTEGGNDFIFGGNMGDTIKGGAGNDLIYGSSGVYDFELDGSPKLPKPEKEGEGIDEDLLIGGEGNDLISGGVGKDTIWAGDEYKGNRKTPLHEDTNNPHNKNNPNEKGDWILGGKGNDFIHGSTNNDFLQGGADKDTIYGGGGNDVILGDGHIRFGNKTQTITTENLINYNPTLIGSDIHTLVPGVIGTTPTVHRGAALTVEYNYDKKNNKELNTKQQFLNQRDRRVFEWDIEIDTEQGDYKFTKQKDISLTEDYHILDEKFSENTNDLIYGGAGNDLIIGQYGNDELWGGAGDDILWGDDNRNLAISGNDTLRGGKGNDTLIGGKGNDTYLFDSSDLKSSQDNKIIKDQDGEGKIQIGITDLSKLVFHKIKDSDAYETDDKKYTLSQSDNGYVLTSTEFGASIAIEGTPRQGNTLLGMTLNDEPKNTAPTVQNAPEDQTLLAGKDIDLSFAGVFFDAEDGDDKLTYSLTGADGFIFDPDAKTLTGTAPETGTFNLTLTAKDSKGLEVSTSFKLTVNERPTVVSDLTLPTLNQDDEGKQIDIANLFSDKEGDTLTYSLSAPSGISLVGNTLVIDPKTAPVGSHSITLTATDSLKQSTDISSTITIMAAEPVKPEPTPPKPPVTPPTTEPPTTPPNTPDPATPPQPPVAVPPATPTPNPVDPVTPTPTPPATPIDPVVVAPPTPTTPIAQPPVPVAPPSPSYNPAEKGKTLWGSLGHDNLIGDGKANTLLGLLGDDVLNGGLGNDKLYGDLGHDTLIGGKDDDWLEGGFGNDTYQYAKGDGKDTIKDIGGLDMLKITGLSLSDLGFVKQGKDLFIDTNLTDNNTNEGILIENYFQKNLIDTMAGRPSTPTIERLYVEDKLVSHNEIDKLTQIL